MTRSRYLPGVAHECSATSSSSPGSCIGDSPLLLTSTMSSAMSHRDNSRPVRQDTGNFVRITFEVHRASRFARRYDAERAFGMTANPFARTHATECITDGSHPAAGREDRLRPLTEDKPKGMVEVAGKPIRTHCRAVDRLADYAGVVGYKSRHH